MTRGSHPPSLLTRSARAIADDALLSPGDAVMVAVSGGRDSMALLHVLGVLGRRSGYEVSACGVDHGLRPEAGRELDLAARLAEREQIPFRRMLLCVEKGGNLQARAREARHRALDDAATDFGAHAIATAHHADDRAETLLLRLLQGSGAAGLAVLPSEAREPSRIRRIRPFIRAPRAAIEAHVVRHALSYADDPSNEDARFMRVRVRRQLLPLLASMNPNIVEHLCALADELDPLGRAAAERGHAYPLPRATQEALATLRRTRNAGMRIELPGGLVACIDRTQVLVHRHGERTREKNLSSRTPRK